MSSRIVSFTNLQLTVFGSSQILSFKNGSEEEDRESEPFRVPESETARRAPSLAGELSADPLCPPKDSSKSEAPPTLTHSLLFLSRHGGGGGLCN